MRSATERTADEHGILPAPPAGRVRRRWRRRLAVAAVIAVAIGAATAGITRTGITRALRGSSDPATPGLQATALATATKQSLSSQIAANATLGYAGSYSVVALSAAGGGGQPAQAGQGAGPGQPGGSSPAAVFTALPRPGQVVRQGQRLYSVSGSPVVLLYGAIPAYRTMSEGMSGDDVRQLNADLAALHDATTAQLDPRSDYFSAATATALESLQARLGVTETASLALGQAVFLPSATRVTSVSATLGSPAQAGTPVLLASSTSRQVTVQLDATQRPDVTVGDRVMIILPGNKTTPGVVTYVGTVATSPSAGSAGGSGSSSGSPGSSGSVSTPTIEVDVKPTDPSATGSLDQAPVQVDITTATARNALVVPVDALLAEAGGYAVEVAGEGGSRRIVPVTLGLFDDADGLVQVSGAGLAAGQSVVVPKI